MKKEKDPCINFLNPIEDSTLRYLIYFVILKCFKKKKRKKRKKRENI